MSYAAMPAAMAAPAVDPAVPTARPYPGPDDTLPIPSGTVDVIFVFCLMQAVFVLLVGVGEALLMGGSPAYLVTALIKAALLVLLAVKVVSGRRWALILLTVLQAMTLYGFWLQLLVGLLPWLAYTVNLVGLLTNVAMPATIAYLCARQLPPRARRARRGGPVHVVAAGGAR
jgi:hypothetical protein